MNAAGLCGTRLYIGELFIFLTISLFLSVKCATLFIYSVIY